MHAWDVVGATCRIRNKKERKTDDHVDDDDGEKEKKTSKAESQSKTDLQQDILKYTCLVID